MTTADTRTAESVRKSLLAAMDRLIAGNPTRSTGRLNVSQLAIEAGVKRWHLTHQHTDLKDQFQARVLELESQRGSRIQVAGAFHALQEQHAELRKHCAVLEERVRTYATVLNLLMLENAALSGRDADSARVLPLPRREERAVERQLEDHDWQ